MEISKVRLPCVTVDVVNFFSSKIRSRLSYTQLWESHNICIIHVATSRFPIQRLLALPISSCNFNSSRGWRGQPRHTIMCNSLGSTWKSRSDSGEHWKGGAPFLGALEGGAPFCIPSVFSQHQYKILWNVHVTSQVVTINMLHLLWRVSLIPGITLIQRRSLWTYICLMEPVWAEIRKNIDGCLSYAIMYCWIRAYLP